MVLEQPTWFSLAEESTAESLAWFGQIMDQALARMTPEQTAA
jgi:hypothetical protein